MSVKKTAKKELYTVEAISDYFVTQAWDGVHFHDWDLEVKFILKTYELVNFLGNFLTSRFPLTTVVAWTKFCLLSLLHMIQTKAFFLLSIEPPSKNFHINFTLFRKPELIIEVPVEQKARAILSVYPEIFCHVSYDKKKGQESLTVFNCETKQFSPIGFRIKDLMNTYLSSDKNHVLRFSLNCLILQIFFVLKNQIHIRNRSTKVTNTIPSPSSVSSIDLRNDILAVTRENRVEIWDPKTGQLIRQIVVGPTYGLSIIGIVLYPIQNNQKRWEYSSSSKSETEIFTPKNRSIECKS